MEHFQLQGDGSIEPAKFSRRAAFGGLFGVMLGMPAEAYYGEDVFQRTDNEAADELFEAYTTHVGLYLSKALTPDGHEPDEVLMRDVEERINVGEVMADDFRRSLMAFFGTMALQRKKPAWDSNPRLAQAIKLTLSGEVEE